MIEEMPDYWKFELHQLLRDYGEVLQQYKSASDQYYRQSPYSNWISEQELVGLLTKLKNLRDRMQKLSKEHEASDGSQYQGNFLQVKDPCDRPAAEYGVFRGTYI